MREYWILILVTNWEFDALSHCQWAICVFKNTSYTHIYRLYNYSYTVKERECRDILCCYWLAIVCSPKISLLKSWFSYMIVLKNGGTFERWSLVKKLVITNLMKRLMLAFCNRLELAEINEFPPKQVWYKRMSLNLPLTCCVNSVLLFIFQSCTIKIHGRVQLMTGSCSFDYPAMRTVSQTSNYSLRY